MATVKVVTDFVNVSVVIIVPKKFGTRNYQFRVLYDK